MHRQGLSRYMIGLVALFGAVAGCATSSSAPLTRPSYTWVGCSTTARNAVGGGTTSVQICAEVNARHYLGSNSGAGVVVAQMINTGPGVEARWGLEVDKQYLILVMPAGSGAGGQFRVVGPGGSTNSNRVGSYYQCLPLHAKSDTSFARFGGCHDWVTSTGTHANPVGSADDGTSASVGSADGPAWVTCETGCCTTDAPSVVRLDAIPSRHGEQRSKVSLASARRTK